jgi:hypothetical protein
MTEKSCIYIQGKLIMTFDDKKKTIKRISRYILFQYESSMHHVSGAAS